MTAYFSEASIIAFGHGAVFTMALLVFAMLIERKLR